VQFFLILFKNIRLIQIMVRQKRVQVFYEHNFRASSSALSFVNSFKQADLVFTVKIHKNHIKLFICCFINNYLQNQLIPIWRIQLVFTQRS